MDARSQDRVTLRVQSGSFAGRLYHGWLKTDIKRSMEALAGTFTVPVGLLPGDAPPLERGDAVELRVNDVPVITGYVLAAEPFYDAKDCGLQIVGRDRSGDLASCSAIFKGGQWKNAGIERVVRDLVQPFGIKVIASVKAAPLGDFKIEQGETVAACISRAARLAGVLVLPDGKGNLLITRAGSRDAGGAIVRGQNVIAMRGVGSDEERHSDYYATGQSNTSASFDAARLMKAQSKDPDIKRYLPLIIQAPGNISQAELKQLAEHTRRVRRGHSMGYQYTVEGWCDAKGQPWAINTLVPVYDAIAGLNGERWLVCEVNFACSLDNAAVTELTVRPREAYDSIPEKQRARGKAKAKGGRKKRAAMDDAPLDLSGL